MIFMVALPDLPVTVPVAEVISLQLTQDMTLYEALMQIESGGDVFAIGDRGKKHKAYGCLQIRQPALDDVNRAYGTNYKAEQMLGNQKLSFWVFEKYMELYATEKRIGRPVTDEDRARIWNAGPNGWRKDIADSYWQKIKKII